MTRAETKSQTPNQLGHPGALVIIIIVNLHRYHNHYL